MRRWGRVILVLGIILVLIVGIVYLQSQGYLENFTWETLTMWIAGLTAPIKLLFDSFSDDDEAEDIMSRQEEIEKQEEAHRKKMDTVIQDKERRISELDKEIKAIEAKVEMIDMKKKTIDQSVGQMSDEEKIQEAQRLWGK